MKEYYHMTGEEVCQSVNGTLEPLTESQVKEHIAKYGRNEIETVGKKSVLQLFLEQFQRFFSYYTNHFCNRIWCAWRLGKCACNIGCNYDECSARNCSNTKS